MEADLRLAGLWIYPVKSCAGHEVASAAVHPRTGLKGDREWILVTPDGRQAWMGEFHRMTLIQARLGCDGLVLSAPGVASLHVPFEPRGGACTVQMWNDIDKVMETFPGIDAGAQAGDWIGAAIGQPLRLVRLGREAIERQALLPLHIVSLPSWRALNQRLGLLGHPPIELARFRPNLIVDGIDQAMAPFAEESLQQISWRTDPVTPPLVMTMSSLCVRCVMPNIDLATAEAGREPLALLSAMSRERGLRAPTFGINAAALGAGQLAIGMTGRTA